MVIKKWNQTNMKECDKQKRHISSKLHMIYICSNNVRHPVTETKESRCNGTYKECYGSCN